MNNVANRIIEMESINAAWRRLLLFNPRIKYHYVSYEQLTGPWKRMYLEELIRFAGVEADPSALVPHELVQLHEGTCSDRVHGYAKIETLLGETQTTAACAMLEGRPLKHSTVLSSELLKYGTFHDRPDSPLRATHHEQG